MTGKQKAPEIEGEFGKRNELLQDLRKPSTEAIVDFTEYSEVQRKDKDTGPRNGGAGHSEDTPR
jgi:hypothetical protein